MSIIIGLLAALSIVYMDFGYRRVHVFSLLGLALSGLVYHEAYSGFVAWVPILLNLAMVAVILGGVYLWSRWRMGGRFWDEKLGRGDAFMLVALACWLSPEVFVGLYCGVCWVLVIGLGLGIRKSQVTIKKSRVAIGESRVAIGESQVTIRKSRVAIGESRGVPGESQLAIPLAGYLALGFCLWLGWEVLGGV